MLHKAASWRGHPAPLVGLSAEQYSRIENGATLTAMLDRMVRLLYATLAKVQPEVAEGVALVRWQAEVNHEERIVATQDAEHHWMVTTKLRKLLDASRHLRSASRELLSRLNLIKYRKNGCEIGVVCGMNII